MKPMRALFSGGICGVVGTATAVLLTSCGPTEATADKGPPHVTGNSKAEMGKYIVMIAGCNDCHTPGGLQGQIPADESNWLTGVALGFRGPWGTTYAPNLRHKIKPYIAEDLFVKAMKKRDSKPPMPWWTLHNMTDEDLGAVYAYIRSLPEAGVDMPDTVPPGMEPGTPYIVMDPPAQPMSGRGAAAPTGATQPGK